MNRDALKKAAACLQTPAYVFDADEFKARAGMVQSVLGEGIDLCYSIKANPFLLAVLPDVFSHVEVCSPGELEICKRTGIPGKKIIFSGVNKTAADIAEAAAYGADYITAESLLHLSRINEEAVKRGETLKVLLRLAGDSQFGMDRSEVTDILAHRDNWSGVHFAGIHYFTGTMKKKAQTVIDETEMLSAYLDELREICGYTAEMVEYGTGFGIEYFKENGAELEENLLREAAAGLLRLAEKTHLSIEMGRFFAAPCGYYLTSVADRKSSGGINYLICDGGIHQVKYDGQLKGMQIPPYEHLYTDERAEDTDVYTVCGSLCTTADVIVRNLPLCDPQAGDILVFKRCGAYSVSEGIAMLLSRDLPEVWISCGDELRCVRRRIQLNPFNCPEENI